MFWFSDNKVTKLGLTSFLEAGPLIYLNRKYSPDSNNKKHKIDIRHMIHHSDRGVQYTSTRYTQLLSEWGCRISMTRTGDPLHNAPAERINNTLKNSWYISTESQTFEEARQAMARAIRMYNKTRPHQAIGGQTPMQLLQKMAQNLLIPDKEEGRSISPKLYAMMSPEQRAKFASCQRLWP